MAQQSKKVAQTLKIETIQSYEMALAVRVVQCNIPDYLCLLDHIDFGRTRIERTLFFFVGSNINIHLSGYLNSKCHTEKHTDKLLL